MIPKKIFQTYENKYEDLPKHYKQTSLSWQRLNPGWTYIYHNKNQRGEYVKTFSPELYKLYNNVENPFQADIWRYLILKNEGGVYADMDSFCSVPMDYVLKDITNDIDIVSTSKEKIFIGTQIQIHINNANFAAVKESKVLNECIENILLANVHNFNQEIIHQCFSNAILNNIKIVSTSMKANHGYKYKEDFDENSIKLNYYGKKIFYGNFLTNYYSKNMP